jgi:universal stress protein A
LILLVDAGGNDSTGVRSDLPEVARLLASRGYATLTVGLLTPDEDALDQRAGESHLDVPFLANRVCLSLAWIRCQPALRTLPVSIVATGMAVAGALVSAPHHHEVRALVSLNGRGDLAEGSLEHTKQPTLLLVWSHERHLTDLNRLAAIHLRAPHRLEILPDATRDTQAVEVVSRIANWIDQHSKALDAGISSAFVQRQETDVIALKNVLVATDFGEPGEAALRYGVELARRFDAVLHVLHVVEELAARPSALPGVLVDSGPLQNALEDSAHASLATLLPEPDRSSVHARLKVAVSNSPAHAVLEYAREARIDMIIVGTHGRHGLAHLFLGSVAEHVSRAAECPVLTVRAHERDFILPDEDQLAGKGSVGNGCRLRVAASPNPT